MAIILNGLLSGKLGNNIYFIRNKKNYVRSAHQRKERAVSHPRCILFSRAARMCRSLRQQILPAINIPKGNVMYTGLMSSLLKWIRFADNPLLNKNQLSCFDNCTFTAGKHVRNTWYIPLKVTRVSKGVVQLKIPAFIPELHIKAPACTVFVECKIVVAGSLASDGSATGSCSVTLRLDYNGKRVPEKIIKMNMPAPKGALIVTAMSLEYTTCKNGLLEKSTDKKFMPAGIVSTLYV
jgi:hypothetical protein